MPTWFTQMRARPVAAILLFVGMGFSTAAPAEDLLEVYQISLDNDATYQAAKFQYSASTEAMPQARAGLLPDVAFSAEHIQTHQDIVSSDNIYYANADARFPTDDLTLSLTQPLFRYDAWIGYKQSKVAVAQAKTQLSVALQQLIVDVADSYFAVLAAQDQLEYARVEKTAVAKQLEFAKGRTRTGLARVTDLYDAQARFSASESREIKAENALDDAYQALRVHTKKYITDLSPVQDQMPLTTPDPAEPEQWIKAALEENLTLLEKQQSLELATQEVKRQKAGHMPTLDFLASRNRRDTEGSLLGGGSDVQTTDFLVRFKLPIYEGGSVNSKMRQAANEREQSREEMEAARREVVRATRAAYLGVLSGIKNVQALKQAIIAQEKTIEVKTAGLRAGMNTMLEVLDAQRDLYFARTDFSKARYDYLLSTLRLKQSTGSLSVADLEEINRLMK